MVVYRHNTPLQASLHPGLIFAMMGESAQETRPQTGKLWADP